MSADPGPWPELDETDINLLNRQNRGHALRAVGYLLFAVVLSGFMFAVIYHPEDIGYELHGQTVDATVDRIEALKHGRSDEYRIDYSFDDNEGHSRTGASRVFDDRDSHYRVGDRIKVQYRATEPDRHRPTHESNLRQLLGAQVQTLLVGSMLTLAVLALVFLINRREKVLLIVGWLARKLPGGSRREWKPHSVKTSNEDASTFPFAWEKALRKNMALYNRLTPAEQKQLQDLTMDFVPAREWVGHGGLEVTDEMKATIAAQACLLLLGIENHDLFASVPSIIIHPGTFNRPGHTLLDDSGTVLENQVAVLGEAWYRGPVLLSWREVVADGQDADGGSNVVYHEFAHQLDFQGQDLDEALSDAARENRRHWGEVMQREFDALVVATQHHQATLLDPYGATDIREFFAVSTECFFEKPIEMQATYPALYDVLRLFYRQDPAERLRAYRASVDLLHHKEHPV